MAETKTAMGWKIYAALDNETFRAMFSATHNSFNAYSIMQNKKICLVNGSQKTLGTDGMAVFLQFIVAQCYAASFRRGDLNEEDRHLSLMLVDEAAYVYTAPIIGNVLRECRKFGLGFFAATQLIESIPSEVKAAIFGATAIRFAGPVQDGEAAALAREMFCDKQFIRSMRSFERSRSEWALHVEGVTGKRAIRVTHPLGLLEAAPKMTEPQVTEVRARNHAYLTASEKKPQSSAPAAVPAPMETQPAPSSKIPPGTPWNSATEEEV